MYMLYVYMFGYYINETTTFITPAANSMACWLQAVLPVLWLAIFPLSRFPTIATADPVLWATGRSVCGLLWRHREAGDFPGRYAQLGRWFMLAIQLCQPCRYENHLMAGLIPTSRIFPTQESTAASWQEIRLQIDFLCSMGWRFAFSLHRYPDDAFDLKVSN